MFNPHGWKLMMKWPIVLPKKNSVRNNGWTKSEQSLND